MARSGTLTVRVIGDTKPLGKSLKGIGGMAAGAVGTIVKVGAAAAAAGAVAAASFGVKAVKAASDLNETLSKSNTIFKDNAGAIEKWANGAATNIGQSKTQALEAASTFGNMFDQLGIGSDQAAKMSTSMVELASDFASFHNADVTQVLEAQTAAFRGEYDAVQRFVPTINAAAVEQKALAMGLAGSTKELTQQHKALATQQLLLEGAGEATGDFERTSDSLANQTRILKARFEDFSAKLGTKLLPIAEKVAQWAGRVMPRVFGAAEVAVDRLLGVVAAFGDWWAANGPAIVQKAAAIGETISTTVAAALRWLGEWWAANGPTVIATAQAIWEAIKTIASVVVSVVATVIEHWGTIGPVIAVAAGLIATALQTIATTVVSVVTTVKEHWGTIGPVIAVVAGLIATVFIPHWVALGAAAVVNSATNAAAWVSTQVAAIKAAVVHSAQVVKMIAGWVKTGAAALLHAGKVVVGWAMTGAAAVKNAAIHVAQVAVMVAKWVFLGAQSLLHAGKVALAWLIAMGPIALVIAAVVGLVAVIVKNWGTIKRVTGELWQNVTAAFNRGKDAVVGAIQAALNWLRSNWPTVLAILTGPIGLAVLAIARHRDQIVGFFRELPGRIRSALGNLRGLLVGAGSAIIQGLWDGLIASWRKVERWLIDRGRQIQALKGPIDKDRKLLVDEGSAIMAGLGVGIGKGWSQVRDQLAAITSEIPSVAAAAGVPNTGTGTDRSGEFGRRPAGPPADGPMILQLVLDGRVLGEAVVSEQVRRKRGGQVALQVA
ncbi:MAG: hypothetical protein M3O70_08910 [Actinomycetota bacterium]|nr:hypothetical protein [Actinomycetota bacterium]